MRAFQGRYYLDVSGDVPSEQQLQQDLSPAEVQLPPRPDNPRPDTWTVREENGQKTLVRIHNMPRLSLFSQTKITTCPVSLDELTGKRLTIVRPLHGGPEAKIEDDLTIQRNLQDRWVGETQFEMKMGPRPLKIRRSIPKTGQKRPPEKETQDLRREAEGPDTGGEEPQQAGLQPEPAGASGQDLRHGEDDALPADDDDDDDGLEPGEVQGEPIPPSQLNEALLRHGSDIVDGLPVQLRGSAGSNQCPAPGCELPGGHAGVHEGPEGKFLYDNYEGRKMITEEKDIAEDFPSSRSSTSSEELLPDGDLQGLVDDAGGELPAPKETFFAAEVDLSPEDYAWLSKNSTSRKANIWLAKKLEKSKEVTWSKLSLEEKKSFDLAQAKELSQVATSRALRNLTKEEKLSLDYNRIMNMRWVLTFKGNGDAKARLVILGFKAHNLCEVETSSATMGKVGRNMLLCLCAALNLKLKAGDVTSAFLQTDESLEGEDLYVWAPPELATYFGGDPRDPRALKVLKAFYGLVHSPRKWWETVVAAMKRSGWKALLGDKCLFVLQEEINGKLEIVGLAGLHVDDFLIAGKEGSKVYDHAVQELREKFRFGKWSSAEDGLEFAGCWIQQSSNGEIYLDQENYTNKFIDELDIDPKRPWSADLTPADISAIRGVLGTASWRATQSSPQFLADTSLLLSEINKGSVATMHKVNKLVREMKRTAGQKLRFPSWPGVPLEDLAVITWADASNHNRPDKSITVGILTGIAPKAIMNGEETPVALIQWKSGKTPRQCLGSNGAEVQAITIGEDQNYLVRGLLFEMMGNQLERKVIHKQVATVPGCLVMDSRGIYDAATRNLSCLHGLRESRAGYELTLSIVQATQAKTVLRWVCGIAQLADSLTKFFDRKCILQFLAAKQVWRLTDDPSFTAGRKVNKRAMEKKLQETQDYFINSIRILAEKNNWPWQDDAAESLAQLDTFTD